MTAELLNGRAIAKTISREIVADVACVPGRNTALCRPLPSCGPEKTRRR